MNDPVTDLELLTSAAKAAGLPSEGEYLSRFGIFMGLTIREDNNPSGYCWNPLTDDKDAFRLAVQLNISIEGRASIEVDFDGTDGFYEPGVEAWFVDPRSAKITASQEVYGTDPYAATRRAVVRTAAALAVTPTPPKELLNAK